MNALTVIFQFANSGTTGYKVSKMSFGRTSRVFVSKNLTQCYDYVARIALDEGQSRDARVAAVRALRFDSFAPTWAEVALREMMNTAHDEALREDADRASKSPACASCGTERDPYDEFCTNADCPRSCEVDCDRDAQAQAYFSGVMNAHVHPVFAGLLNGFARKALASCANCGRDTVGVGGTAKSDRPLCDVCYSDEESPKCRCCHEVVVADEDAMCGECQVTRVEYFFDDGCHTPEGCER